MSKSHGKALALTDPDIARFTHRIIKTDRCHIWDGSIGSDGYGRFWLARAVGQQRVVSAHVVAAVLAYGEMPTGSTVLHDCDVRLCMRTDASGHVRVSTQSENVRQAVARGRSRGPLPGMVDMRGPAGASRAIQAALRASATHDPVTLARALSEALRDGDPLRFNLTLFDL